MNLEKSYPIVPLSFDSSWHETVHYTIQTMNAASQFLSQAELTEIARKIRVSIVSMLTAAGSGHTAGALGMVEIFTSLYFDRAKIDPSNPSWPDRDYILLSTGHTCPVLYATLAEKGFFDKKELDTFRDINTRLQGHPHLHSLPGIEITSGALGQGLSQAVGMALGLQLDQKDNRVYCIMSDGEQQEGQTWEAYMYAGDHSLSNLTAFIDRNHIQIGGNSNNVLPLNRLSEMIRSFGWETITIDGHSFSALHSAMDRAEQHEQPTAIICETTPGKGVSFIESDFEWHGKPPSEEELQRALEELGVQS